MVQQIRIVHAAVGNGVKEMHAEERRSRRREGLYAARPIASGERLTSGAVLVQRPAVGIRARHLSQAMGLVASRAIAAGDPIHWEDLGL